LVDRNAVKHASVRGVGGKEHKLPSKEEKGSPAKKCHPPPSPTNTGDKPPHAGDAASRRQGNGQPEWDYYRSYQGRPCRCSATIAVRTASSNPVIAALESLPAAVSLHFAHYNLVRLHKTTRVTPAMAANVTDRLWSLEELVDRTSN
jgi:hypothetical protein